MFVTATMDDPVNTATQSFVVNVNKPKINIIKKKKVRQQARNEIEKIIAEDTTGGKAAATTKITIENPEADQSKVKLTKA